MNLYSVWRRFPDDPDGWRQLAFSIVDEARARRVIIEMRDSRKCSFKIQYGKRDLNEFKWDGTKLRLVSNTPRGLNVDK
jgi:hypothetical protein